MTDTPGENEVAGRDAETVSRFVERFAGMLTDAGMPRMPARVFVTLLVTDSGKLTSAELAESLRASPGAISGAVRYLTHVGMIGKEREPGKRRDHYVVYDDSWHEALVNRDEQMTRWVETTRDGSAALGPDTPAGKRLTQTSRFMEFLQMKLTEMLDEWREYRTAGYGEAEYPGQ